MVLGVPIFKHFRVHLFCFTFFLLPSYTNFDHIMINIRKLFHGGRKLKVVLPFTSAEKHSVKPHKLKWEPFIHASAKVSSMGTEFAQQRYVASSQTNLT